ncbi:OmpH family outer membrane protein [Pseudodesulfovibrio sediminis]|uniref:Outer membrane chaperone Skp (OmpH) n=1 Tax=Pseudodesulfovibrio sediminis TaxID=2810563 RepID=A0ABN6ENA1_9BACT|nr:OmpH family outer membrane protein [Pseudodesulfovibrio sediminis]BCS87668.1 hypothetical protein PSDVSF_09100 [Pseudodesulfovibrio sediminis]
MKILKVFLFLSCTLLLVSVSAFAQQSKVGFVNPQRIINESKLGRVAQEDLARLGKEKDRRVQAALAEVEALQEQVKDERLSLAEQEVKEQALHFAVQNYEKLVKSSNVIIQAEERRLIKFVMRRADSILKSIARQMGFTMILTDPEIIGYVDGSMDITDQVISQLNAMI